MSDPVEELISASNAASKADKISAVTNYLKDNPDVLGKLAATTLVDMTPADLAKAKNAAMGEDGKRIMKLLQSRNRGGKAKEAVAGAMAEQSLIKKARAPVKQKQVLLINTSRQIKPKKVTASAEAKECCALLGHPISPPIISNLKYQEGFVYYYSEGKGVLNKKASALLGTEIIGNVILAVKDSDLPESFIQS